MGFVLIALSLGGLAGFFLRRWWAAIIVILVPVPFYLAIALGIYGNGFGDNWQFAIPLWIAPVIIGFFFGALARRAARS